MATLLKLTGWIFTLRPLTWFFTKLIAPKGKRWEKGWIRLKALGIFLSFFYLILAAVYTVLVVVGFSSGDGVLMMMGIFGVLGLINTSYAVAKYHKDEDDSSDDYSHTDVTITDVTDTHVHYTASDRTKRTLGPTGVRSVLTAPLCLPIRLINFIATVIYTFISKDHLSDLALGFNPQWNWKIFFWDIVNVTEWANSKN